jgi:hypothetical protein
MEGEEVGLMDGTNRLDDESEGDTVPTRRLLGKVEGRDECLALLHVQLLNRNLL